jgi:hypothetical protein
VRRDKMRIWIGITWQRKRNLELTFADVAPSAGRGTVSNSHIPRPVLRISILINNTSEVASCNDHFPARLSLIENEPRY